ncbi:hypothetical protein LPJ53_002859 [Coemansia erecta]|uniref:RRM domain-containing protein n=1 Tax=Coemansia erecta TaxID=147472 RepID=A0A9W7XXE8_9FUNG|nr:hypothetical protein LPJ53_002859 [Coemansia erecta]
MAFSSPFTLQTSSSEFKFDHDSTENRRSVLESDPTMIDTKSSATSPQQQQQQQQPSLTHALSQLQLSSLTTPTSLQYAATIPQMQPHPYQHPMLQQQSRLLINDYPHTLDLSLGLPPAQQQSLQFQSYPQYYTSSAPPTATGSMLPSFSASAAASVNSGPVQLWMGDIEAWMDDDCIRRLWAHVGEAVSVKMIRDRLTGGPANYCFIEVPSQVDAERLLTLYNGKSMPTPFDRPFRLNWASGMVAGSAGATMPLSVGTGAYGASSYQLYSATQDSAAVTTPAAIPSTLSFSAAAAANSAAAHTSYAVSGDGPEYSLFVGDLAPEITDIQLVYEFRRRYASVKSAKVVTDMVTMQSRGYGFVRFSDEAEQQRAIVEMYGQMIGSRAVRVDNATPKRTPTIQSLHQSQQPPHSGDPSANRDSARSPAPSNSSVDSSELYNPATDPDNTTVFVGGLTNPVSEDELFAFFAVYGEVDYCKIPPNRGCGFVTFAKRANAETAMRALNGHLLGGSRVRLSWGRSQSHARHNYRHHHHRMNHNRHQSSAGGSSSGANSHRNSVSEQYNQLSRRSVSLGKSTTTLAPAPATALGLGLSGALFAPAAGNVLSPLDAAEQKYILNIAAAPSTAHSASLHSSIPGHASAAQHSSGFSGATTYTQQQQQQQYHSGNYTMMPHSAFHTLSPIHSETGVSTNANASITALGGLDAAGGADTGAKLGDTPRAAFANGCMPQSSIGYAQHQACYTPSQQESLMLATPMSGHAPGSIGDSPLFASPYGRQQQQQQQQQQQTLALRNSGQFDSVYPIQQQQQQQQLQNVYTHHQDTLGSGTMLPSLAACPSELLTRRLSALNLGGTPRNGTISTDSPTLAVSNNPHPLDRRPSAGVIGQRRLSTKASFLQQQTAASPASTGIPHKSASQLSFSQMWQQQAPTADYSLGSLGDHFGALSTPASSARLSTSSMSLLAMTPSMANYDGVSSEDASRRQSTDDQRR